MSLLKAFGKLPAGDRLQRIRQSPNYQDGSFRNLVPTSVTLKDTNMLKMLKEFRRRPADSTPSTPLPSIRTDLNALSGRPPTLVWFGHSSYLLKFGATHILVDPVFSGNASPVSFFAKAFPGADIYKPADMPDRLEAILLTHDHYDHLDYKTIVQLRHRTHHFYTSLGVGAHLESWGIPAGKITELDWWETVTLDPSGDAMTSTLDSISPDSPGKPAVPGAGTITLTATPARHFSGRGLKRGRSAWSSFVLRTAVNPSPGENSPETPFPTPLTLFLGGDSGFESHFKAIGEKFGPVDLAILECGQYGVHWPYIHMFPEQTVQAALDLKAKTLLPVHWAKFTLALHPWNEPIRRVTAAAKAVHLPITTPRIGEPIIINHHYPNQPWYDNL